MVLKVIFLFVCTIKITLFTQFFTIYDEFFGLTTTFKTLIITAIKSFEGNPHDSKTIEPLLDQMQTNMEQSQNLWDFYI